VAREVLGVAGAVIGGIYGGAPGAQLGFMIGSTIGGIIDGPEKIDGPALSEAPIQTSRDGVPIPIIWGTHHCHGNIIIKNPETYTTVKTSQGKGGGTTTSERHRHRTFGIGVCRGPIVGISRIWENNELVYGGALPLAQSTEYAEGMRIYYGGEDQLPDPDLEAIWGVGDTPYFRGLAYIVWVNKDLTDIGGAIPEYRFEVNGSADMSLTSKPYPISAVDGLIPMITFPDGWAMTQPVDALDSSGHPGSGDWGETLVTYSWEEAIDTSGHPLGGDWGETLVDYSWTEAIDSSGHPLSGDWGETLVVYSWEEAIDVTAEPNDGTLT